MNDAPPSTEAGAYDQAERAVPQGLYGVDPRIKLALLVTAVFLNIVVARLDLSLALFFIGLALAVWSRISWQRFALLFLAPAWATLIVFLGFSIGFGTTPIYSIGTLTIYKEGMLQGLSAAARVACDMSWIAAVFLTTPFSEVLAALRWFRLPAVLLDVVAMSYRYASLLFDEFHKMRDVARIKGGMRNYGVACRSTGMILAQVILRAYDRTGRIQEAMVARGENTASEPEMNFETDVDSCPNQCDITPVYDNNNEPVLSCRNITYAQRGSRIIQDLSLTISKGEIVVLCGPNGAGKTTLLRLFAGILAPDAGTICLFGRKMDRKYRREAFRRVAMLFQDPNDQLFCTHVRQDIAYGPENLGLDFKEVNRLVNTAMALMEVSHLAHRPIHRLSHGEMKRVGLAGLIAMQPPLILLDEPTASLDPASANHLIELIRHLNSHHGYTLIIVTHNIDLAAMIAKRILILTDGKITADGTTREILTDQKLLESARLTPPLLTQLFQSVLIDPSQHDRIPVNIEEATRMMKAERKD
jgi:cobalt ECF transporter T component CbiQ